MSLTALLSLAIGVPIAAVAMILLFRVEANQLARVPAERFLNVSAAVATALMLILVVARFIHFA